MHRCYVASMRSVLHEVGSNLTDELTRYLGCCIHQSELHRLKGPSPVWFKHIHGDAYTRMHEILYRRSGRFDSAYRIIKETAIVTVGSLWRSIFVGQSISAKAQVQHQATKFRKSGANSNSAPITNMPIPPSRCDRRRYRPVMPVADSVIIAITKMAASSSIKTRT